VLVEAFLRGFIVVRGFLNHKVSIKAIDAAINKIGIQILLIAKAEHQALKLKLDD
jgi:hypothetical protein